MKIISLTAFLKLKLAKGYFCKEYFLRCKMTKKGVGIITEVHRNYGIIMTNSFKMEYEIFPFEIIKEMIVINEGKQSFKFSKKVAFELKSTDGFRRRGRMLEAVNLVARGAEIFELLLPENQTYPNKVRDKFEEFKFMIPSQIKTDDDLYEWLKSVGFQPRMLDYLTDGIFISESILSITIPEYKKISNEIVYNPSLLVVVDHVDKSFRMHILNWIIGIEDAYKSFISNASSSEIGQGIAKRTITEWKNKNNQGKNQFDRARNSKRFRRVSDNFDYVGTESVSIEDLMEELDLSDIVHFIKIWHKESEGVFSSPYLKIMVENINLIEDLFVLRNAAAHGKPIIPNFVDPDFNPNWDLEFDNPEKRTKVENWILYKPLKKIWLNRKMSEEYISSIIQTVFGNPYRKSWMILNYIYFKIIVHINEIQFRYFIADAQKFLSYETDHELINIQLSSVNLLDLRLSDMGSTTLSKMTGIPEPYKEIANEAYDVWKIFES